MEQRYAHSYRSQKPTVVWRRAEVCPCQHKGRNDVTGPYFIRRVVSATEDTRSSVFSNV